MRIRQISVFIENRAGRLETVAKQLGDAGINIRALSLADTSDFGILRLIVNRPEEASELLRRQGFTIRMTEVVAVEIPDVPGGLAGVLEVLGRGGVNVEYMYAFVEKARGKAVVVFRFENLDAAVKTLEAGSVRLLKEDDLLKL
jgi:hypothetical protein